MAPSATTINENGKNWPVCCAEASQLFSREKAVFDGEYLKAASEVTVTQRPGTAKAIMFVSLHDETGYCDHAIKPAVYQQHRTLMKKSKFLPVHAK